VNRWKPELTMIEDSAHTAMSLAGSARATLTGLGEMARWHAHAGARNALPGLQSLRCRDAAGNAAGFRRGWRSDVALR
jgi:hypothetical protein